MRNTSETKDVLIIDNYDSFTYNIYQLVGEITCREPIVIRNDRITLTDVAAMHPTHIIISPGPGNPKNCKSFGISNEVIRALGGETPILGVCLGHQGIAHYYGASIIRSPTIVHGKTSSIYHDGSGIYEGIPNPFCAMRYHSLIVDKLTLPSKLRITSQTAEGIVMGLAHTTRNIFGVQFHPESIGTPHGKSLLLNFLSIQSK